MTDLIGRVLGAGRYRIDSELGGGGQAIVFRGTHLSLDMAVAIKILSFGAAGDHAAQVRFQREAQRAAALRHPNIVTIYDYAFEDGMYYIVSDFIEGMDLQKLLQTKPGPMPVDQVLAYVRQVGEALDYAHRQNIVHRDIKPANILLDRREG
ncbi:MAG: serine/threonine protein kinase, partial [Anaerolineales bacterium]